SREGDLIDLGAEHSIVEKTGAWYSYKGERIGQGRENARQFLKDNPDVRKDLDIELRRVLGLLPAVPPSPTPEAAAAKAGSTNSKAAVRGEREGGLFFRGGAPPPTRSLAFHAYRTGS